MLGLNKNKDIEQEISSKNSKEEVQQLSDYTDKKKVLKYVKRGGDQTEKTGE